MGVIHAFMGIEAHTYAALDPIKLLLDPNPRQLGFPPDALRKPKWKRRVGRRNLLGYSNPRG